MLLIVCSLGAVVSRRPASAAACSRVNSRFAGSWAPLGTEDVQNDSVPVDYLGLALTDEGARAGAVVRRVAEVDDRAAVPGLGRGLRGARSVRTADLDAVGSSDEAPRVLHDRRVGRLDGDDHLDGRSTASVRACAAHAGRIHDRAMGGRRAGRAHDAPEGGLHPQDRCAVERSGDDRLALLPPWRRADGPDGGARSGLSGGARDHLEGFPAIAGRRSTTATRASPVSRDASRATACPTSRRTRTRS